ncbi:MAG: NAD(P)/FAD-dependent oxidoreductase [Myxococcaceae bacterium]|nr:NAD(P)/FAD-dependent oxidoreductase [Myxococcaceae bacterium]
MARDDRPHVVILGGGFGGLYAARALEHEPVRVTLIDRKNHHLFQPLLYQVATAALNPSDIAAPLRGILRRSGTEVLLAEATAIDPEKKRVLLTDGEIDYDYLIVATGATHSYFGHDEWARYAPGLKTLDDALEIRRRVLLAFEAAEREPNPAHRRELLTFVIVGAGATGVEMAGALAEIAREALVRDFHHIDPATTRVVLVEGVNKVLPPYPDPLSREAAEELQSLGVEVRIGAKVTSVDEHGVIVNGNERIAAHTVIWAAGVAASPLAKSLGVPLDRAGRVSVTPFLTVPGHDDIFVVGDLARIESDGELVPGVAPAAMQMGVQAAKNVLHQVHGAPMMPFTYWDRGTFAVIGRGAAVGVAFRRFQLKGSLAWLAWLCIHLLFLIGFRNKIVVLVNWAYSYLADRRAVRLITGASGPVLEPEHAQRAEGLLAAPPEGTEPERATVHAPV